MQVFLDTEFTDFAHPELLSIGLVTADGAHEFYAEIDLKTDMGQARHAASCAFVRDGVLPLWGRMTGAACAQEEMGRRTAQWLLARAAEAERSVEICHDYPMDYELMQYLIYDTRDMHLWNAVREVIKPANVYAVTGTAEGERAAEVCFTLMRARGLERHHALADAHALAYAYASVTRQARE